jgi:hypothetical protein
MAEVLSRQSSARKMSTVTELSQSVTAGVTKSAVPGSGRRSRGETSVHRVWSGESRETKGVKGPSTVTTEKRAAGSQIHHSKPKGVKVDIIGVVCGELANGKKKMNYLRSNKDVEETKRTRSRANRGDRKTRPITNHDRRRIGGVRGMDGREDTNIRCGVEGSPRVGNPIGANWWCRA